MIRLVHGTGRVIAPLLAALMLSLGVVVPLVDVVAAGELPALESEHRDATCGWGHDHTVCTQHLANQGLGTAPADRQDAEPLAATPNPGDAPEALPTLTLEAPPARAPPLV